MSSKILIVGPDGFLAAEVIRALKVSGENRLFGLGRKDVSRQPLDHYFNSLTTLRKEHDDFDIIYLLASFIPYGAFDVPNAQLIESNIQLVADIVRYYPKARVVFASSVSVYGPTPPDIIKIDSPFDNPNLYGLSKIAGETIIRTLHSYAIIRFSSIIGPGMGNQTMIPKMIASGKAGHIKVWGDGKRKQNYIDVRDAARMCISAAASEKSFIALGVGTRSFANKEVAEVVQRLTEAEIEYVGEDASPSFVYDTEESYALLNFRPDFDLMISIKDILRG